MMKKNIIYLFIILICCSFARSMFKTNDDQISDKDKIAIKIIDETATKIEKKYQFHPCGFGRGGIGQFRSLGIDFQVKGILSKSEAREIIIDCMEEFLNNINSNEEIKPFLKNYPFTPENVSITLYISDSFGNDLYHPNLEVVDCSGGKIRYRTNDPENEYQYKERSEESLQEALRLINRRIKTNEKESG